MKTEFDFKNHQVGDKVYHIFEGWGTVQYKEQNSFYVEAQSFYYDGKSRISDENPTIYPFNPFEERMIEVFNDHGDFWEKRILIKEIKNGEALCWEDEDKTDASFWDKWREIQPKKELTTEEKIEILWEKHNNNG
jgi:hypothetical protein